MIDILGTVGAVSSLSLVGLCWSMVRDKNGKYVRKDVCDILHKETRIELDANRNILENKIIELKDDILEIKVDVKEILRNDKNKGGV